MNDALQALASALEAALTPEHPLAPHIVALRREAKSAEPEALLAILSRATLSIANTTRSTGSASPSDHHGASPADDVLSVYAAHASRVTGHQIAAPTGLQTAAALSYIRDGLVSLAPSVDANHVLHEALQAKSRRVFELETDVDALTQHISHLKARIEQLEELVDLGDTRSSSRHSFSTGSSARTSAVR